MACVEPVGRERRVSDAGRSSAALIGRKVTDRPIPFLDVESKTRWSNPDNKRDGKIGLSFPSGRTRRPFLFFAVVTNFPVPSKASPFHSTSESVNGFDCRLLLSVCFSSIFKKHRFVVANCVADATRFVGHFAFSTTDSTPFFVFCFFFGFFFFLIY